VHDPEAIEQWKKESCVTTTYRLKGATTEETYTWATAMAYMRREIVSAGHS